MTNDSNLLLSKAENGIILNGNSCFWSDFVRTFKPITAQSIPVTFLRDLRSPTSNGVPATYVLYWKNVIRTHRALCRLHTSPTPVAFRQCYLSRNELISPDSAGVRRGNFFRFADNHTFVFYEKKKQKHPRKRPFVGRQPLAGGGHARLIDFAVRTTKDYDGRTYASGEINTHTHIAPH